MAFKNSLNPSSITLCPLAFGATTNAFTPANLATAHYVGRRSVAANPVPRAGVPTSTANNNFQQLEAPTPTAITMLHEMFHLVLGNDATYAAVGEVYDIFTAGNNVQVVGLDYDYAVANPELYMLLRRWHVTTQSPTAPTQPVRGLNSTLVIPRRVRTAVQNETRGQLQ